MECFEDGAELLEVAEHHGLEGVVSKRRAARRVQGMGEGQDERVARCQPGTVAAVRADTLGGFCDGSQQVTLGPRGAQDEFTLAATAQNLRRLAKFVARPPSKAMACVA